MENEDREKQAEVQGSAVLIADVESFVEENSANEGQLNHKHKQGSVENVNLVVGFQSVLLFVLFHECTI